MASPSQAALRDYYVDQIHERGFVNVEFGIQGSDIDPLFSTFRDFFDLTEQADGAQFSEALTYVRPGREADSACWVMRRQVGHVNPYEVNQLPSTESKDTAHISPASIAMAEHRLGRGMPGVMRSLLAQVTELHEAAKTAVRPAFEALGVVDVMLAQDRLDDVHIVRLLRYLGTEATHKAGLHFDRAKFTLAAWESSPGLVGAPGNNAYLKPITVAELDDAAARANSTPVAHRSGSAKLFAGAGYNRLPAEVRAASGNLPLLLHGVKNENPGQERDAVVVFMNHHISVPGTVATTVETDFDELRAHVARRDSLAMDVA